MKVRYLGHGGFSINVQGKNLVFDPFITPNPLASHIDVNSIDADYILITHGHGDHIADVETIAKRTGAKIITNYEIMLWFNNKGLEGHGLNHGGSCQFDFGTVNYVTAIHSSALPDGSNGGNPGGFVIQSEGKTFYFAGDTALTYDMKLIPMLYGKIDFAIMPMGDLFTMGYKHAAIASDFVECDTVIGCHYDTFDVISLDKDKANAAFEAKEKQLLLPGVGETIEV